MPSTPPPLSRRPLSLLEALGADSLGWADGPTWTRAFDATVVERVRAVFGGLFSDRDRESLRGNTDAPVEALRAHPLRVVHRKALERSHGRTPDQRPTPMARVPMVRAPAVVVRPSGARVPRDLARAMMDNDPAAAVAFSTAGPEEMTHWTSGARMALLFLAVVHNGWEAFDAVAERIAAPELWRVEMVNVARHLCIGSAPPCAGDERWLDRLLTEIDPAALSGGMHYLVLDWACHFVRACPLLLTQERADRLLLFALAAFEHTPPGGSRFHLPLGWTPVLWAARASDAVLDRAARSSAWPLMLTQPLPQLADTANGRVLAQTAVTPSDWMRLQEALVRHPALGVRLLREPSLGAGRLHSMPTPTYRGAAQPTPVAVSTVAEALVVSGAVLEEILTVGHAHAFWGRSALGAAVDRAWRTDAMAAWAVAVCNPGSTPARARRWKAFVAGEPSLNWGRRLFFGGRSVGHLLVLAHTYHGSHEMGTRPLPRSLCALVAPFAHTADANGVRVVDMVHPATAALMDRAALRTQIGARSSGVRSSVPRSRRM